MAKVTINGEVFAWDASRSMSEALALEDALKCRYADWEADLQAGSARALAGFIWLVWRRNGRDVPIGDILTGAVEVDLMGLSIEPDGGEEADPTAATGGQAATPTTGTGTSGRSQKS